MGNRRKMKLIRIRYFLVAIIVLYTGSVFIKQHTMIKRLENEKKERLSLIQKLEKEVAETEEKLEFIDTIENKEKIAREELGMTKPEERIYIDINKSKNKFINGIGD